MSDNWFNPSFKAASFPDGTSVSVLENEIKKGTEFVKWLAEYKSKVQGVPSADQYMNTYKAMKEEVENIQELHGFTNTLCDIFVSHLPKLKDASEHATSLGALIRVMDMIIVINYLKMFNSSIMNDFAMFKRSFQQIRGQLPSEEAEHVAQQSHSLHFFLANANSVVDALVSAVTKETGSDRSLQQLLKCCVDAASSEVSVSDAETHCVLRVLVYTIFIIGSGDDPQSFKSKGIKQARPVIKNNQDVHVHGDLTLNCLVVLKSCHVWDDSMTKDWEPGEDFNFFNSCVCM